MLLNWFSIKMQTIIISLIIVALLSINLTNSINFTVKNAGSKDFRLYSSEFSYDPVFEDLGVLQPDESLQVEVPSNWTGQFLTYPSNCQPQPCLYGAVTVVRFGFGQRPFDALDATFDYYDIDLNILPTDYASCELIKCDADILSICPEGDQVRDSDRNVIACFTSVNNYQQFQQLCPQAHVDGYEFYKVKACRSENWEINFG